jgi:hypothetical protein
MNRTPGFPVARTTLSLTWYGSSSLIRSSHTCAGSPSDTHTSV